MAWWQNARDAVVSVVVAVGAGSIDSLTACQSTGFFVEDAQGVLLVATQHGFLSLPDSAFRGVAIALSDGQNEIVRHVVADAGMIDLVTLRINSTYRPKHIVRLASKDACKGDSIYVGRFMDDQPLFGVVTRIEDNPVLGPRAVAKTFQKSVKPSNSGSPVFNQEGEVVGLISESAEDLSAIFVPSSVLRSSMISRHDEPIEEWWEQGQRTGKHAFLMAQEAFMKEDFNSCLWALKEVIDADSLIAEAWHLMALAASQVVASAPDSEQAQLRKTWIPFIGSSYQRALALRPHTESYKGVGDTFYTIANFDSAITYYKRALDCDSTNWRALRQLAYSYRYIGDTSRANTLLKVVENSSPDLAPAMSPTFEAIDSLRKSKQRTK